MADELHETHHDSKTITIVEWADIVNGVLPEDRLSIHIIPTSEASRKVEVKTGGKNAAAFLEKLR
jgi:tRNA A37 threonylcarbamoyladenosine biosynthesis protein TsaE